MAILGIDTKCYILALFIRDDGERFVLGNGYYEFKDSQLHFQANTIANDIVEVQGNDGYLLAGQVRRPGTQNFDGYVADGTVSKSETEEFRRDFFKFFRKNYFYKVVYVFPDGTAIQRKRGFLVDDPTVQELYQQYPEYHVALNFEDVNYYSYSENDSGEEIYAKEAIIYLSAGKASGGLVWDEYGAVSERIQWIDPITISGKDIVINNTLGMPAPISDISLKGDAYQKSYNGKNLFLSIPRTHNGLTGVLQEDGTVKITGTATSNSCDITFNMTTNLPAGTYTFSLTKAMPFRVLLRDDALPSAQNIGVIEAGNMKATFTVSEAVTQLRVFFYNVVSGTTYDETVGFMLEAGSSATDFEPYVGGIPSPNPNYPQAVQTVTGGQVIAVTGGDGESAEYEINLGKNLCDASKLTKATGGSGIELVANEDGSITINGTSTDRYNNYRVIVTDLLKGLVGKTVTISVSTSGTGSWNNFGIKTEVGGDILTATRTDNPKTGVITASPTGEYSFDLYFANNITFDNFNMKLQVEMGDEATSFAPYFEPIELCKIGDYQDYIYKSGDDWYVHKEVAHVTLLVSEMRDTESFPGWDNVPGIRDNIGINFNNTLGTVTTIRSNIANSGAAFSANTNSANSTIFLPKNYWGSDHNRTYWKTNYPDLAVELYYGIRNEQADTKITNSTLISQLDALGQLKLLVGENNIITSSSESLNAELEVSYYSGLGEGVGYVWEEGTAGGPTVVEVDSIDNVYPIWEVKGPAINPQLSVLTTNTTINYSGTVTESQTLVIDMFNKTAKLNGTSVIGNVFGDWVNFAPGNNRVVYTTNNPDALPSRIEWQEIVG